MKKILFVCTGNTCRSPMAMVWFNHLAQQEQLAWIADSAGLSAYGDPVHPNAIKALEQRGILDFDYTSKRLNPQHLEESDRIVAMTEEHKQILLSVGVEPERVSVLGNGIPDPYGGDEAAYAFCLAQIDKGIRQLLDGGDFGD